MTKILTNKRIVLGVSGSISAYKAPDIVRRLQDLGADVRVILSSGGAKFITDLSLQTVSKHKVHNNLWDKEAELAMGHIELAKWADIVLVAPASANTIANIATGRASDLLTSVILATKANIFIAPAMNVEMYKSNSVINNLTNITKLGFKVIEPEHGEQACGDIGQGRLAEPSNIANFVAKSFESNYLTGKEVLITLGATVEQIDPVRYISNHSSGKMGSAIADVFINNGASVTIVYGNISIDLNNKATCISALSAEKMHKTVMENIEKTDIFVSVAAVSDYKAKNISNQKIKKDGNNLTIELEPTKDILKQVCNLDKKPICIGFAAETQNLEKNAKNKLKNKGCDAIILNDVSNADFGFKSNENEVYFITKNLVEKIDKNTKQNIAEKILKIFIREFL